MSKVCKTCEIELSVESFSFRKDTGKYRDHCKSCRTNKQKEYYKQNKEYFIDDAKARRAVDPELHKQRTRASHAKYKEERNKISKQYYEENKKELFKKAYQRSKKRRKEDLNYKLRINLSHRFRKLMKGIERSTTLMGFLGCSIEKFKAHMQTKFHPNPETNEPMTWKNYGLKGWHIDHIYPLAKLDLTKEENQKKAFHYTNLQPLWAKDNYKKKDKLPVD